MVLKEKYISHNNQLYLLEKIGLSDDVLSFLKIKGLIIPDKIEPVKNPIKSPSEKWYYSIADCYTPKLDEIEKNIYYENPHLLTLTILDSVNIFYDLSIILNKAIDRILLINDSEDKLVLILIVLWLFHGCLDNNYLKYDRHLEYLDYEISPVGFWWKKFKKLIRKALLTKYSKVEVNEKTDFYLSKILKGQRRLIITKEVYYILEKFYKIFKKIGVSNLKPDEIINKIRDSYPNLYNEILEYSYLIYSDPNKIITDSLIAREIHMVKKLISSKSESIKIIEEIKNLFINKKDREEFERTVEVIEDFIFIQEFEGLIAYGKKRNCKFGIFETLIRDFELLKDILNNNDNYINIRFKNKISNILRESKEVPQMYVSARDIIVNLKEYFKDIVIVKFDHEIRRIKTL